jgi:pyruvate, water dikinase
MANAYVLPLEQLRMTDVASVGGKNSSLGELISQLSAAGVRVPGGFATTAQAFTDFLQAGGLKARIDKVLSGLDVNDMGMLSRTGAEIRQWVVAAPF